MERKGRRDGGENRGVDGEVKGCRRVGGDRENEDEV